MERAELRLLLVDDDEDDYLLTRDLLAEIPGTTYHLDWVDSYDAAREAVDRREHELYLFDYRLGEHTGLELLRESRAAGCRAPIILLTGQGDHSLDMEAMKAGAADYLVKGEFNAAVLERAIRYSLEQSRMVQALEDARQREQRRFQELDQLKSDLIAFVSHELRAPLTSVRGYAQTLQLYEAEELIAAAPEFLGHIISEADRLLRLIDGFLDISTVDSGRQVELVSAPVDVRELVDSALNIVGANATHCTFAVEQEGAPAPIIADRDKLLQVLINLLSNADKYSPAGGVVTVRVRIDADRLRIEVADRGLGIRPEAKADLFTPFYRIRDPQRRKVRGAGLGLYLCKHLVEAHGGTIGVESEPGVGSTFWFEIPRRNG